MNIKLIQMELCSFKVDKVSKEVIDHFNENVPTADTSYIFSKKM